MKDARGYFTLNQLLTNKQKASSLINSTHKNASKNVQEYVQEYNKYNKLRQWMSSINCAKALKHTVRTLLCVPVYEP